MGRARHLSGPLGVLALVLLGLAIFAAGCGSGGSGSSTSEARPHGGQAPPGATARACTASAGGVSSLRAVGVACSDAAGVAAAWRTRPECARAASASRTACAIGAYRCLALVAERGLAVSCARPGRSISFLARRD